MGFFGPSRTYLDWAAAAPVNGAAVGAYARAISAYGNPSSPHTEGREAKKIVEDARVAIARELSMKADDIIFTAGATEANNIAIQGICMAAKKHGVASPHLLYLPSAHASVVETMRAMEAQGARIEQLVIKDGKVDVEALKKQLRSETALVSMDFICGETGTIWNTREVQRALIDARGTGNPIYMHVDASQAPATQSIERSRLAGDLIVLDAQKIGGVRGIGVLAVPRTVPLMAIMHGGGQERALRPGTPLPAHAAAFAAALLDTREKREAFVRNAAAQRVQFIERIKKEMPDALVNEGGTGVPNILNISLPGRDTDYLVALLDEAGFAVSTKSACESDSDSGSRAVLALTGDEVRAKSTLRISWGASTHSRDLQRFAAALAKAVRFVDSHKV